MKRTPLSMLSDSGASDGDVPVWDDAAQKWVPDAPTSGGVASIVAGTNITVDDTDPANPIVSATGGGGSTDALDPGTLHSTYGDHFDGSGLDGKWTQVTYVGGDETYQDGGGSYLTTASRSAGAYYYQSWGGGTSDFNLKMKALTYTQATQMFGLIAVDASGAGVAGGWYNSPGAHDGAIVAHLNAGISYDSGNIGIASPSLGPRGTVIGNSGLPCWYHLVRSGNTWRTRLSLNGQVWGQWTPTITVSFTPARIAFGTFQASLTTVSNALSIDWFDVQ